MSWLFRRTISIDNTNGVELTDYPVHINLSRENFIFGDTQGGEDIRFYDGDTELSHFVETYNLDTKGSIWVKIPTISGGVVKEIDMYYGDTTVSGEAGGKAVFDYYNVMATTSGIAEFDLSSGTSTWTVAEDATAPTGYRVNVSQSDGNKWKYKEMDLPNEHYVTELWYRQHADLSGWTGPLIQMEDGNDFYKPGSDLNWGVTVVEMNNGSATSKNQYSTLNTKGGGIPLYQWCVQKTYYKPSTVLSGSDYIDTHGSYNLQGVDLNTANGDLIVTYDDHIGRYDTVSGTQLELEAIDPGGTSWGDVCYDSTTGLAYSVRFTNGSTGQVYSFDADDIASGVTLVADISTFIDDGVNGIVFDGTYWLISETGSGTGVRHIYVYDTDWNFVKSVVIPKAGGETLGLQALCLVDGLLYVTSHEGGLQVYTWDNVLFKFNMVNYLKIGFSDLQGIAWDPIEERFYICDRDSYQILFRTFEEHATTKMLFSYWDHEDGSGETTHYEITSPKGQNYFGIGTYRATNFAGIKVRQYTPIEPIATVGIAVNNQTPWYSGVSDKLEFTIDSSKVDTDLTNFPLNITISSGTGIGNDDLTSFFTDMAEEDKYKIAVTATIDSVETECFVEIERWSDSDEQAVLWARIPTIASGTDTTLYLYYDATASGNSYFIGETGDSTSQNVWNTGFIGVWHLGNDPSGGADAIIDSTILENHGTTTGSMTSGDVVDGQVGKALDFDGSNDAIDVPYSSSLAPTYFITTSVVASALWTTDTGDDRLISKTQIGGYLIATNEPTMGAGNVGGIVRRNGAYGAAYTARSGVPDGWHLFTMTYDGRYTKFYVDSVLVDTDDAGDGYRLQYSVNNSLIMAGEAGVGTGPQGNYYDDLLDEIRISDVSRSAAWIKADYYSIFDELITYSSGSTPPEPSTLAYYYSGYVTELDIPADRQVYLYLRNTGAIMGTTTSSGVNGYYYVTTSVSGEHFIVVLDDDAGTDYNALIADRLLPQGSIEV